MRNTWHSVPITREERFVPSTRSKTRLYFRLRECTVLAVVADVATQQATGALTAPRFGVLIGNRMAVSGFGGQVHTGAGSRALALVSLCDEHVGELCESTDPHDRLHCQVGVVGVQSHVVVRRELGRWAKPVVDQVVTQAE